MIIIDFIYGLLCIILCVIVVRSDFKEGIIRNKVLCFFAILAILLDIVYYGYFARDLFKSYVINVSIILCVSLLLFYTHTFAGGDTKLAVVLSLCYPGSYYLAYSDNKITLILAIGLAIIGGYIYLLAFSLIRLMRGKGKWNLQYIKNLLLAFLKSFIRVMVYLCAVNIIVTLFEYGGFFANAWIISIICLIVTWIVGKQEAFHKWLILIPVAAFDVIGSVCLRRLPFSIHFADYVLVIILVLCRLTMTPCIYEKVNVDKLKQGMILSTASSMLMQNSKITGLPVISHEDLRSKLNADEINSIQCWAKNNDIYDVAIVRKIPFAIFLAIGFGSYFIIWWVI